MMTRCSTVIDDPAQSVFPDFRHRLQYETAGGAQIDFGLGKTGLHHGVFTQRVLLSARHLVARDIDKTVERAAGDAAGDAGEAYLVAGAVAHAVEWAALAAFLIEFAGDRMIGPDKEVL